MRLLLIDLIGDEIEFPAVEVQGEDLVDCLYGVFPTVDEWLRAGAQGTHLLMAMRAPRQLKGAAAPAWCQIVPISEVFSPTSDAVSQADLDAVSTALVDRSDVDVVASVSVGVTRSLAMDESLLSVFLHLQTKEASAGSILPARDSDLRGGLVPLTALEGDPRYIGCGQVFEFLSPERLSLGEGPARIRPALKWRRAGGSAIH